MAVDPSPSSPAEETIRRLLTDEVLRKALAAAEKSWPRNWMTCDMWNSSYAESLVALRDVLAVPLAAEVARLTLALQEATQQRDEARAERDEAIRMRKVDQAYHEHLQDRFRVLQRERNGEVWIWQDDEDDTPESLACPVLMQPDVVRRFVAAEQALTAARAEQERMKEQLEDAALEITQLKNTNELLNNTDEVRALIAAVNDAKNKRFSLVRSPADPSPVPRETQE